MRNPLILDFSLVEEKDGENVQSRSLRAPHHAVRIHRSNTSHILSAPSKLGFDYSLTVWNNRENSTTILVRGAGTYTAGDGYKPGRIMPPHEQKTVLRSDCCAGCGETSNFVDLTSVLHL